MKALTSLRLEIAITSAGLKRTYRDEGPDVVGIAVCPFTRCCQIISSDTSLKVEP